jgi:putative ABC transport system substrate-binding protein
MEKARMLFAALLVLLASRGAWAAPDTGQSPAIQIGILMFSGESRYQEATKGFLGQLAKAGFREPRVTFFRENAGANKGKAAEVVQKFAAADLDLVFTLGTSATTAVARQIRNVPIVFSMVYDPVEAGVVRDWESSGNNTTGMSSRVPMARLMDSLRQFESVKRLAVLYTPGEKNSETQLKDLQDVEPQGRIRVVPVALTTREEIAEILPEIVRTSDALFVTGSNMVDSQVALIVQVATRNRVITITHLEDLVEKGVLLGLCADAHELGRRAGEKAVRILKGARPSSIPIEASRESGVILNRRTEKAGGFDVPPSVRSRVTRFVE